MSEHLAFEFTDPAGDALRFEWNADAMAALSAGELPGVPVWRLGGELDWDEIDAVRVVSATLGERMLALAALRPRGAEGHGDEVSAAALGDAEGFDGLARALLSTEASGDASVNRIGLELYPTEESLPLRVAGDAVSQTASQEGGVSRSSILFELRGGGDRGTGVLDVLRRA